MNCSGALIICNLCRSNERGNRLNFDFPESIGDIEQRSMVTLGPLDPAGVLLCSGQLNEFNDPGGGQEFCLEKTVLVYM